VWAALTFAGCSCDEPPKDPRQQIADDFGGLPGLAETPDPKLRDELSRIEEEGGTPELLAQNAVADAENVAAGLANLFPPWSCDSILQQAREILPAGEFDLSPTGLERAIRFRQQYDDLRRKAREALKRPHSSFGIQYTAGFFADPCGVDAAEICVRLEVVEAAERLVDGEVAGAIESLGYIFRLTSCLAAEKHPTVRLEAARHRAGALALLQSIVEHPEIERPKITDEQLLQLRKMVQKQIDAWPPDADAWIGDRALGLHAYEMVRAGRLTDLLTEEEKRQFKKEGLIEDLPAAAQRHANRDELYYLETMRKIIDASTQPYYQRTDVFEAVRNDLHRKRNSMEFPMVAGRLLLPGIERGHALQAWDRANCEVWALALTIAAGRKPPDYRISPLSGEEYVIDSSQEAVTVRDPGAIGFPKPPLAVAPRLAHRQIGP
jgi:hypothetical protein